MKGAEEAGEPPLLYMYPEETRISPLRSWENDKHSQLAGPASYPLSTITFYGMALNWVT